jgi:hypothetical protein
MLRIFSALSFALMQKKQKIKDNPNRVRAFVRPAHGKSHLKNPSQN